MSEQAGSAESAAPSGPALVVGVGASAGGLEALERLFEGMPLHTGMAFVVVQHLSPDYKSLTDELLARRTALPIRQVEDGMTVGPDAIYLLPPRKEMILADGRLLLTDKDPAPAVALPIDGFFRSLARDAGPRAVGIILSGTGSDGSRALRDLRDAGGLVVVQDPATARFDGMPRSALTTGCVGLTLAPEDMPAALVRHLARRTGAGPSPEANPPPEDPQRTVFRLLRDAYDIDFSAYKPETVVRRTERRLSILRLPSLEEYARRLAGDPEELNILYKDLLIGVTQFFRDPEAFELLRREVLPDLLERVRPGEEFRAWAAGCATGEEAYSLALAVQECLAESGRSVPVRIFATDVHRSSLDHAGTGVYSSAALGGVDSGRLERYFVPKGDGYQVSPALRKLVVFAQHNVLKDAPFTKLDLVTCRNLLIYFQPAAQRKALSLFHFGLKTGGVLFLGPSEGVGELAEEFESVETRWKLFRKRRDVRLLPDVRPAIPERVRVAALPVGPQADPHFPSVLDALLERCMPACVLVNASREVVRTFGGADRYLRLSGGWFSADVLSLVGPELRTALAGALPRVLREGGPVVYKALRLEEATGTRTVDVTVEPVRGPRPHAYALVRFDEAGHPGPAGEPADEIDPGEASAEQVVALESELRSTKENLQAMIEELETSNEEMQAANEELVASNEELQSTNEELHSVNEELYTVNAEYQRKIVELTELSADMENLLTSTDVHTIFLDRELCIRKYTPRMAETFHLMPQDVGRRIDSFTHTIEHPAMLDDLRAVLVTAEPRERQVRDRQGRWFLLRILPYRTATEVAGVVLTLIDIDRLRRAEAEAERKELQLASILRNSPNWVFMKDLQGRYLLVDEAFKRLVGCDPVGKTPHEIFPAEVADALSAQDARVLTEGREVETELTLPHPDGPHTYLSVMFPVRDETGRITSLGGIRTDITQLKQAEARAREAVAQRDRFLAVLSHELRNPLAAIVNAAAAIERLGPHASESTDWVRVIGRRSRHMTRLLEDLLDVARVTQNKVEVRREVFDLGRTVADVLEEVRPWMEERRLRLEVVRPGEPLAVDGDPARLQQCQVNLLMNAAKYTPDGGCVWYEMAAEEGQAVVRIRDTGIGMSADMLSRVFDLFVQADETLDRTGGGIGVGLTLVKAIVERHGGTVEARSNGPGLGSEFVVRLPLTGAAGGLSIPPRDPPLPVPRPLRLLLVEDDADIRRSLAGLLELDGYEVRPAADGPAALAEAERFNPDVALLDIGIPGMDGYELARRLRDRFPAAGPRLVALTGYGRPADRLKAAESGFDAHLTKPFDPRELARVLAQFPARSLTAPAPPG